MYFYYYWWILIPAIVLSMYAQAKVKSNYTKYAQVMNSRGLTGFDVARTILDENGLYHVQIKRGRGMLSDHFNPRDNSVNLSPAVHDGNSISSMSIAAHECGHAVQYAKDYAFLKFRSAIAPAASIATRASGIIVLLGILLARSGYNFLIDIGILLYVVITLFHLVTLPVEFDASKRALVMLYEYGLVEESDIYGSKKVLSAAALTYVAAMLSALLTLIRLIAIRNRD